MPFIVYDDDSNPIEIEVDPKELSSTLLKAREADELLKKSNQELEKLRSREHNFANLRTKTKAEQEEFKAEMSVKERMLFDKIESLEGEITKRDEATLGKVRTTRLKEYSNGDEELEKKILGNLERLGANPLSPEEVNDSLDEAFALTQAQLSRSRTVNPLNRISPSGAGQSPWEKTKKNHADTPEGQALAKNLGLNINPKA